MKLGEVAATLEGLFRCVQQCLGRILDIIEAVAGKYSCHILICLRRSKQLPGVRRIVRFLVAFLQRGKLFLCGGQVIDAVEQRTVGTVEQGVGLVNLSLALHRILCNGFKHILCSFTSFLIGCQCNGIVLILIFLFNLAALGNQSRQLGCIHSQRTTGNQHNLIDQRCNVAPSDLDLVNTLKVVGVEGRKGFRESTELDPLPCPGCLGNRHQSVGGSHAADIHLGIADGAAALKNVDLVDFHLVGELIDQGAALSSFHIRLEAGGDIAVGHKLREILLRNLGRIRHKSGVGGAGHILAAVDDDFIEANPTV